MKMVLGVYEGIDRQSVRRQIWLALHLRREVIHSSIKEGVHYDDRINEMDDGMFCCSPEEPYCVLTKEASGGMVFQRHCKRMRKIRNMGKDVNSILIHRLHTHDVYSCGLLCHRKIHDTTCVPKQVQCHYIVDIDGTSCRKNVQMAHQFLLHVLPLLKLILYIGYIGMPFC